jgi:CBS-domain-containing membrane protein
VEQYLSENTKRLKVYVAESDLWRGKPLYFAILEVLIKEGVAGATVTRGIAGFGARSRIHTASILRLSEDIPLIIEVVDTAEKITAALEKIYPMVKEGLITSEDVKVMKYTHRYLNPLPVDRLVSEVMTKQAKTLSPDMSIRHAWEQMLTQQVKAFPVISPKKYVIGILTDEDLINRAGIQQRLSIAKHFDSDFIKQELNQLDESILKVRDVMTTPVITIQADTPLGNAVTLMKKHQLKRLPVINENLELAGILSRFDILRQIAPVTSQDLPPVSYADAPQKVGDIMSENIPVIHEKDDLSTIIHTLLEKNSHRVIVVNDRNIVTGILSDADVVTRLPVSNPKSILTALRDLTIPPVSTAIARDLMSSNPLTAKPDQSIVFAIQRMIREGRKWMVVVDDEQKPIGLVDRQILLEALVAVPPV